MIQNILKKHPKIFYVIYLLVVTAVLDAAMARIFWKRLATHPEYPVLGLRCADPFHHHSLERDADTMDRWGHDTYHVITDSLGFKDSMDRAVEPEPGHQRIIFIGDSFTEGVGLPFEKTFVGIISRDLDGKDIEVLNAGVCSYSPKLYFLKTRHLMRDLKLKFDKLVVFIDMSDIQDEIIYKDYAPEDHETGRPFKYYLKRYAIKYSVIGNFGDRIMRDTWSAYAASTDAADVTLSRIMDNYRDDDQYEYERSGWYSEQNYAQWGREGSALAKHYMSELVSLCKANNIEVIIAVYPWPRQVYENQAENKHVLFWKKFAGEQHLRFINFFPFFMASNPGQIVHQYYFPGNMHFNEAGNMLIAREFLKWYKADTN